VRVFAFVCVCVRVCVCVFECTGAPNVRVYTCGLVYVCMYLSTRIYLQMYKMHVDARINMQVTCSVC